MEKLNTATTAEEKKGIFAPLSERGQEISPLGADVVHPIGEVGVAHPGPRS